MSQDHRPPIRNPFLPPVPVEPEAPGHDVGGLDRTDAGDPTQEDRLAEFRLGPSFVPRPAEAAVAPPAPLPTVRILVVCTGNICRSAYVQHALQAQLNALLGDRGHAEVTSAGTGPNQALTVPGPLLDLAPSRRVRTALAAHQPQQLTGRLLRDQDLVLAATDDHLDEVLREDPSAVRRTFTVLGAGTLLRDHGEELATAVPAGVGVTALVAALAQLRSRLIASGERPDADLPDPFRGPAEGYASMVQDAQPIVELLAWEIARALDGSLVEDEEPTDA